MNDKTYSYLCAFLLGLGQMCMFTGYDTQSFIVEPVLHSVHDRKPGTIDAHAGYYGAAVTCITYTLANLAAPWVLGLLGSKLTLVLGSTTFTLYLMTFFYVHFLPFYLSSALMGVGFALYYTGNGGYSTEHSTRETIERNAALTWAIGTSCMVVGGITMLFTIVPPPALDSLAVNATDVKSYRAYEDDEIRLMFGAFAVVAFASNVIFALLPSRPVADCLAGEKQVERVGFVEQLRLMGAALADRRMLELAPVFCLLGSTTSLWIVVYPTALIFTQKLTHLIYLPAYYSIVLGGSDMIMGFILSYLSKRVRNFGQKPTMVLGYVLHMAALVLVLLSTPAWSTNTPNDDASWLITPSQPLALFIAALFGAADNCLSTSRTILAALALPAKRAQVFSISKFYQSLTAGTFMLLSPFMSIPMYFVLIGGNCTVALVLYFKVANETRHAERKITVAARSAAAASINPAQIRQILSASQEKPAV